MRIGINLGIGGGAAGAGGGIRARLNLAEQAESLGFDAVWVMDRLVTASVTPAADEGYEALLLLSALAQRTRRVEIGVIDLATPLRHPLVTAKMLSTADRLSGGRVICGVGTGGDDAAFAALGVIGYAAERDEVTDDYLRAIKEAWLNTGPSRYTGEYVRFAEIGTFPHPVRQPHIPIWIYGEDAPALRRAARLGSGLIVTATDIDTVRQTIADLRRLAERDRRDPDEIKVALAADVTISTQPSPGSRGLLKGTLSQLGEGLSLLRDAGVGHLIATVSAGDGAPAAEHAEALAAFAGSAPLIGGRA